MKKLLLFAIVILGFSAVSFGQAPVATAPASATLVDPLTITKTEEMNFATVAGSSSPSTIVMSTAGVLTPSVGAYVITGTPTAASFSITGAAGEVISITLPGTITLTASGGSEGVTVGTFTDDDETDRIPASGPLVINVGGTLTLPANVEAGVYTNTTDLKVTVNYN